MTPPRPLHALFISTRYTQPLVSDHAFSVCMMSNRFIFCCPPRPLPGVRADIEPLDVLITSGCVFGIVLTWVTSYAYGPPYLPSRPVECLVLY